MEPNKNNISWFHNTCDHSALYKAAPDVTVVYHRQTCAVKYWSFNALLKWKGTASSWCSSKAARKPHAILRHQLNMFSVELKGNYCNQMLSPPEANVVISFKKDLLWKYLPMFNLRALLKVKWHFPKSKWETKGCQRFRAKLRSWTKSQNCISTQILLKLHQQLQRHRE